MKVYTRRRYASDISSANKNPTDWKLDLRLVHQSKLLINPKNMIIEDFSNEVIEIILTLIQAYL